MNMEVRKKIAEIIRDIECDALEFTMRDLVESDFTRADRILALTTNQNINQTEGDMTDLEYYERELSRLKGSDIKVQFWGFDHKDETVNTQTKTLNINKDSIKAIIAFLTKLDRS